MTINVKELTVIGENRFGRHLAAGVSFHNSRFNFVFGKRSIENIEKVIGSRWECCNDILQFSTALNDAGYEMETSATACLVCDGFITNR